MAQMRITGKVTDALTGEALPFVSVYIKNSTVGTTTDINGQYHIRLSRLPDSLTASFVGYITQSQAVKKGEVTQSVDFSLATSSTSLKEVLITPGENPAYRIMRQVMAHKKANDKRQLAAYQYEAYTKMQFSMDNLAQKKPKPGLRKAITSLVDTQSFVIADDGTKVLPFFISEALSDYFYNRDPRKTKEVIKASRVSGIGLQDGNLVAQVIGNAYQDYNFYQNWVSVLRKDFISPIADGWKGSYTYELLDSMYVGDTWCYQIKVDQKRPQDLAFNGHIWIADSTFALRKIDVRISKAANINFVEGIHLIQEELPTAAGPWMPVKTALAMKIAKLSASRPGILARIFVSARNIRINQVQKPAFFDQPIVLAGKANSKPAEFWAQHRHDTLSAADRKVYAVIDSIRSSPEVKRVTEMMTVLATGYKRIGKISLGPYPYFYAQNNVEGHRLQLGFKTNNRFSDKWELAGFGAYGTLDQQPKFGGSVRYILSRNQWSEASLSHKQDLQRVGFMSEKLAASPFYVGFSRIGDLKRPVFTRETTVALQRELLRGVTERVSLGHRSFMPQYDFLYLAENKEGQPVLTKDFSTTELSFFTRYANNEVNVVNDNERISLGNGQWPVLTMKYTLGLQKLGATVAYQRVDLGVKQVFKMGRLGNALYRLEAGKVFSPVPYPLLEVHLGNESPFYYQQTFNLMRNFEFVSDSYASLHYQQYFEGLLLNSLPLIRKLKWRLLTTSNLLYGHLSPQNRALIPAQDGTGPSDNTFRTLEKRPYAEVGYGIENIFRILRVDAFHRLTYLDEPATKKFGLKFSLQFKL
jgi:Family of unknown function (DUF5686)/CarboxypepD_reg-like domain